MDLLTELNTVSGLNAFGSHIHKYKRFCQMFVSRTYPSCDPITRHKEAFPKMSNILLSLSFFLFSLFAHYVEIFVIFFFV